MLARVGRWEAAGAVIFARQDRESRRAAGAFQLPYRDLDTAWTVRAPRLTRPAKPEPNAPLLMRIVRSPYALSPGKPTHQVVDRTRPERVRAAPPPPPPSFRTELAEARRARGIGERVRPEPRPRPSSHRGERP